MRLRRKVLLALSITAMLPDMVRGLGRAIPKAMEINDDPRYVDVVVVLGGDSSGFRVERGVELIKAGWAGDDGRLLLVGGQVYRDLSWAKLMRERALELGISAERIIIQERSVTTTEDAFCSVQTMRSLGVSRAIVVTSPWHSRRSLGLFEGFAPEMTFISCPSQVEWSEDWWARDASARCVITEAMKYVWPERVTISSDAPD